MEITIPGDPLKEISPNRDYYNAQWRWQKRKRWRDKAALCYRALGTTGFMLPVTIQFHVYRGRRIDPDNALASLKPLIDGLVKEGLVPDDSDQWVRYQPIVWHIGTGRDPCVVVRVQPQETP